MAGRIGLVAAVLIAAAAICVSANADRTVPVIVGLRHSNLSTLERVFWEVSDPKHANYGSFLSRDELKAMLQPSTATVQRVEAWLWRHGASAIELQASGDFIRAEMKVADAHLLIQHKAEVSESIDSVAALIPDETVSAAAAGSLEWRKFGYKNVAAGDATGDPNSQKQSYGIPTSLTATNAGHTQMVWGTGTYGFLSSDLTKFYSDWGLIDNAADLFPAGGFAGTPGGDNFGEATLDVTYISSMALGVTTYVSNTNNASNTEWSTGFGTAMYAFFTELASAQTVPTVLSLSLGSLSYDSCAILCDQAPIYSNGTYTTAQCQTYMQTQRQVCMYADSSQIDRMNVEFMKLGVRGVTIVAASGDGGSHFSFQEFPSDPLGQVLNEISCAYNLPTFPAESPYVTGVGGTQWSVSPQQPIAWTASGGGFSWRFPAPEYQQQAVATYLSRAGSGLPPSASYNVSNRAYPDVATLANNIPMCIQGSEVLSGGTSASAPEFAGIISLINDARLNQGFQPLGFINPRIYALAAQYPGQLFYDMSVGNSNCGADGYCCATGFPATAGFDVTTGLGSPIWSGLIKYLGSTAH